MGRSDASRRVVNYKSNHFTGYFPSRKNDRQIQYESILERDYIVLLESDRSVRSYKEQVVPLVWTDGIEYFRTRFDFEVCLSDDPADKALSYLVEVKPLSKVQKYSLDALYAFARAAAIEKGYRDLELWTEREIRALPRLTNAELTATGDTSYYDPAHELAANTAVAVLLSNCDRFTIREFRSAFNAQDQGYRSAIRMIARGQLIPLDPAAPLDDAAVLMAARSTP